MCGILALLNDTKNIQSALIEFKKGQHRGPESTKVEVYNKLLVGFHRLAINGLDSISNQPIIVNNVLLICNGEIYNYKSLYKQLNITPKTNSDCEVIIHMYQKFGIEQTLTMLDGVFAFVLYDFSTIKNLYVARDPFGVRPLYKLDDDEDIYGFASELKCLSDIYDLGNNISQFEPGTYSVFHLDTIWEPIQENVKYFIPTFSHNISFDEETYYKNIASYLIAAVNKRCLATERPIACLLSGGLDSSLITALVDNFYKNTGYDTPLETYSIGLQGSEDLKNAKIVAEYLDTKHTEIIVTEDEMFNVIPEVIYNIESYDTTTVRASIGNYLLGKYIAKNSEAKVIFNGDGSDELFGGYLYMNRCPNDVEFDCETRRLLKDIHLFDVLRSDKSISSNGLEPRTPFLDKNFVNYVLSLPISFRNHNNQKQIEKYILRTSFSPNNFSNHNGDALLPNEILWRKKEAFSDGVSGAGSSLYQILQKKIADKMNNEIDMFEADINLEKYYYSSIYEKAYPNRLNLVPYYWMPKYTTATDPSARSLHFYQN